MPYVIETVGGNERAYDIYSRLLKDRIVFLGSAIDDDVANEVVGQLLFLDANDRGMPINMYINSPGGVITSGMAILDTMRFIKSPVNTIVIGQACSMGAVLLACGTGRRYALPNATVMIHQPLGGARGQATDMEIQVKHILSLKKKLNEILAERTKRTVEEIDANTNRDNFMTAQEAVDFGIVDKVVTSLSENE